VDTYDAKIGFPSFEISGWGAGIYHFDNDGYKDLFSANSHVSENANLDPQQHYRQRNAVFRNLTGCGKIDPRAVFLSVSRH